MKNCAKCNTPNPVNSIECIGCGFLFAVAAGDSPTPQELASSSGSASDATSVVCPHCGGVVATNPKPSNMEKEDEPLDLSRAVQLPVSGSEAGVRRAETIEHIKQSRADKCQPWPRGESVTMLGEYKYVNGRVGVLVAADMDENEVEVWFERHIRWEGTIQNFRRDFKATASNTKQASGAPSAAGASGGS